MTAYLFIPGIEGGVSASGHERWIALTGYNFTVHRGINAQPGHITDREGTRPNISSVQLYKHMDKSSPLLFIQACIGKAKPSIKLHICTTGDTLVPYMEYIFLNGIISHYEVTHSNGNNGVYPVEKIHINFDKIEMKFTPFDQNHSPQSPIPSGYDLQTATAI